MKNLLEIVRYEVRRHLNRQFIIMSLLFPAIIILLSLLPQLLTHVGDDEEVIVAVVDETGIFPAYKEALEGSGFNLVAAEEDPEALNEKVLEGELYGYIVIKNEYLADNMVHFYSKDLDLAGRGAVLKTVLDALLKQMRLAESGVPPEVAATLLQPLHFVEYSVGGKEWGTASFFVPFALIMILAISMMNTGTMLFYSVLNEKKERMMEIILSSTDAITLLRGKILAFTTLGLFQVLLWLTAAMVAISFFFRDVPIFEVLSTADLPIFLLIFLLSYIFFTSLFAAFGATMEDIQSAQGASGFIFVLPMIPVFFLMPIMASPNGLVARLITFLPLPGGLMVRMAFTSVPVAEMVVSILILAAATFLLMNLAGKIFGTGVLMYGKAFSLKEIWRWIRS